MQQARYYLLGERAVVLELSPPVTLPSQQRIWALAEKLNHHPDVREVVPGMNNLTLLLHTPQADAEAMLALLQQGWESKERLTPESRQVEIPVVYGGEQGPDLDEVARHTASGGGGRLRRYRRRPDRHLSAGDARRLAADRPHAAGVVQSPRNAADAAAPGR